MGARMTKSVVETCMQSSIYQPPAASYSKYSCQFIRSVAGDKLAVLCVSPAGSSMTMHNKYTDNRHVVLYSHGNATDLGECKDICEMLANMLNAHVVVYDYPNYGNSSKASMSESTLNASIEALYSRLQEMQIPPSKIVLMGQSLGSVPTLHLASRCFAKYSAVILISPLASAIRAVVSEQYVPKSILARLDGVLFDNLKAVEGIRAPVAIVHGFDDEIVDIAGAQLLHSRIPARFQHAPLYIQAAHNDIYREETVNLVTEYLQEFVRAASEAHGKLSSVASRD
jgi:pimeloyl-ACP methyl ester carboxylesterase